MGPNDAQPWVLDFETTYTDKAHGGYSLTYMTPEEYIRDPRFQIVGFSVKPPGKKARWFSGDLDYCKSVLHTIPWDKVCAIGHNMSAFDALILTEVIGVRPKAFACTLQMARTLHGGKTSNSLANLCKMYGLPDKGQQVYNYINMRREDFTPAQLADYGDYCDNDVERCWDLFNLLAPQLPANELWVADLFTKMFAYPRLALDLGLMKALRQDMALHKAKLLERVADIMGISSGYPLADRLLAAQKGLRSDAVLAKLLIEEYGITPPTKFSPKKKNPDGTPMVVYAFAKTDEGMTELLEDDDPDVQALAAARLSSKSTINESRIERFIGIAERGKLPAMIAYGVTHTHRASGAGGKQNLQNLTGNKSVGPRTPLGAMIMVPRGPERLNRYNKLTKQVMLNDGTIVAGKDAHVAGLRDCIVAPPGYKIVVADSSQIELRTAHLLAGQMDTVDELRRGADTYCSFASTIYGRPITKADYRERQHGKVGMLQLQYGSGWKSFQNAARIMGGIRLTEDEAQSTVTIYRDRYTEVRKAWHVAGKALIQMAKGGGMYLDPWGLVRVEHNRLVMPGRPPIVYHNLRQELFDGDDQPSWVYDDKEKRRMVRTYSSKIFQNCLAEGTEVLTHRGWVAIERVLASDLVHDGVEWVSHSGKVFQGVQRCVIVDGVEMTPDHKVLTDEGWIAASQSPKPYRPDIWVSDRAAVRRRGEERLHVDIQVSLWGFGDEECDLSSEAGNTQRAAMQHELHSDAASAQLQARYEWAPGIRGLGLHAPALSEPQAQGVSKLRRSWHNGVRSVAGFVRSLLGRHGTDVLTGSKLGPQEQRCRLQPGELPVGNRAATGQQHEVVPGSGYTRASKEYRYSENDALLLGKERAVFDLLNCGPRTRFVVRGVQGPFVVHNCVQWIARHVVFDQMLEIERELGRYDRPGEGVAMTVHDEVVCVVREDRAQEALDLMMQVMKRPPAWWPQLPVDADGGIGDRYSDAK